MGSQLTDRIVALLRKQSSLSASQIAEALAEPGVNRSVVNRVLYADWTTFEQDGSKNPPQWSLKSAVSPIPPVTEASAGAAFRRTPRTLRAWQQRALSEWTRHGRKGIVEAVGGTGKTVLGVRVVAEAIASGTPAVVVVADDAVRARWVDELADAVPDCRVAGLGSNPARDGERSWHVAIVTAATVPRLRQIAPPAQCSNALLVVDELERFGYGGFAQLLTDQFTSRLALTRALDREDQAVRSRLLPYFGPAIRGCDYSTAHAQGLLDPIALIHVGVELGTDERARLARLDALVDREFETLIDSYGAPGKPADFATFVDTLAHGRGSDATRHAKRYLTAVAERTTLLAECRAKVDLVSGLPGEVMTATPSVIFTDRPVAAAKVHHALTTQGIPAATTATPLTPAQRTAMADNFRNRSLTVLVEQRVLDPMIVVAAAEIAVLLARHRDETQLIQRLGRILGPGSHARRQLVVNVFVSGSVEDPAQGDTDVENSLGSLIAETVRTDPAGLAAFLHTWQGSALHTPAPTATRSPQQPVQVEPQHDHPENRTSSRDPGTEPRPASEPAPAHLRAAEPLSPARPSTEVSTSDSSSAEFADLVAELSNLGLVATGEEVGDLIGYTDPADLRALAETAARAEQLVFAEVGGDSDDLLLLGTATHHDVRRLRAAAARITVWATASEDPLGGMYELMSDLDGVRVPPHRLVQIAAFLRGCTPKALL
ncbi:DEAD/DEAH box helicase [Nocardia rhizosphaerae]|uniref:DEAD/DEAH box helicase n=1 Tax=Nocardia rhizosphaerae TaxID=1691571 RepID=A0ABV8LA03_9NOCA